MDLNCPPYPLLFIMTPIYIRGWVPLSGACIPVISVTVGHRKEKNTQDVKAGRRHRDALQLHPREEDPLRG
nr:MAG TPA_asm: hypothetical protein [Caudoviricetes sp.]